MSPKKARRARLTDLELHDEWNSLSKDWFSIYQWGRLGGEAYSESIAQWICDEAATIALSMDGLRRRSFRVATHHGQVESETDRVDMSEKRLVRAMFNLRTLPGIGDVIDYEVPLKEVNESAHGKIDLLCLAPNGVLCTEAKAPNSSDSLIKAVLQAFVSTSLVATCRTRFLSDFELSSTFTLTPAVITFASSVSGNHLRTRDKRPQLQRLLAFVNEALQERQMERMQFFVVEDRRLSMDDCLLLTNDDQGLKKPIFRSGFPWKIVQHKV